MANIPLSLSIDGNSLTKEANPIYLGVQLDSKLNLKKHTENLKKKATARLNLIKKLASTDWGADKNTLRNLYIGYARAIFDYNLALQNLCSKTTKNSIDTVQNHALRLISGGMRTSPTAACEIHTNIEPLNLRRERAALELYERSKRLEWDHPNRILVDKWKPNRHINIPSIMDEVINIQDKHHLPEKRELLERVPNTLPPHMILKKPQLRKSLLDNCNKSCNTLQLKASALETIDSYPLTWIHAYTDGSAFKGTVNAGYGATVSYPNGEKKEILNSSGSFCSNYSAEQQAITNTIDHLNYYFDTHPLSKTNVVIFTDSLSTMDALEDGSETTKDLTYLIWSLHNLISRHDTEVVLQWIPAHIGISGNERADALAKRGASLPQPDNHVSYNTCRQIIRSHSKEEWLNSWSSGKTGRRMHDHMTKPDKKDPINALNRGDQSLIFQLRTQHVPLNSHLNRIGVMPTAACPLCDYPSETVEHHLFFCKKLTDLRGCFLPKLPHTSNCLYSTIHQLKQTCKYFRMASCRRANAHMQLDQ